MTDVVLVTSSFLPRFGGVEEHVLNVARELRAQGVSVAIWAVDQSDVGAPSEVDGIVVRYLPCPLPARPPRAVLSFARRAPSALVAWRRAMRADEPRVLHVHCFGPNGVWASVVASMYRVPFVVTTHGETFGDADGVFQSSRLLPAALRRSLRHAAAVTACSRYAADDLTSYGVDPADVVVIPNGIDLHEPAGAAPAGLPGRYVLGIGRLVDNKGMDLLVEAFAAASLPDDVGLVIAGDGPARRGLERLVGDLGIDDRTLFTGALDRPQVVECMSRAELLVVASRAEAFGIAILEGWRAGLPVIATTHGGPPEFVTTGVDGLLVDPEDTVRLSAAITAVVDDPVLAHRLGDAGRVRAAGYSWKRVAGDYVEQYRRSGVGSGS
ncbi:hypothetical protein ASE27_03245 [Oerskovia sp. Root918]|uniref:glycosyltransferase family 4 protein n=1 Tax=Oerskovia sp. Root918 TaxID=1736607 RepID=UPI0006FD1A05|nr:glycosyltransferase family 4 protein [Oerskovia sp. Root918]KRD47379.1 hypothetical protein ASE27_03245 [Oerskovia sp. Root918]